jgi:hypothetical protein
MVVTMRKTLLSILFLLLPAVSAEAQFIGYTSAQSVTATPYNNVTCTAALAASPVIVANLGQGGHWATLTANSSATILNYTIQASYDGVTFFDISDVGTLPPSSSIDIPNITGTGYYPVIGVKVGSCTPGSAAITIKYAGISLTPGTPVGSAQGGQINKHLAANVTAGGTFASGALRAPFGNSAGVVNFVFTGAGPAGSTLVIGCQTLGTNEGAAQQFTFPLQTTNGISQSFNVPSAACPYFTATYNNGGSSTSNFSLDYAFTQPGANPPPYAYSHITGTTATAVKATSGTVHTLSVNTGAAGTVSLFDLASASCTGTPATNQVAILTATSTTLQTFTYDANFLNGICVKESAAMDVTVSYQ